MGCRWNRWPIRFHPLVIHLSIEEVTIKGCGGEIKQSWGRKLKHTLQEHQFFQSWPTQVVFPCVALVALQLAVVKVSSRQLMAPWEAAQFLFQLLLSPQRVASLIFFYTISLPIIRLSVFLVFTLTHRHIVRSLFSCKNVKSFWNACVFQQLHFNYRFLRLQYQLRLLIWFEPWMKWLSWQMNAKSHSCDLSVEYGKKSIR